MTLQAVLTVNMGSSTVKFAVYPTHDHVVEHALISGNIAGLEPGGKAEISWTKEGRSLEEDFPIDSHADPFQTALVYLKKLLSTELTNIDIVAVAHRVVHGGDEYQSGVLINDIVLKHLRRYTALAPLHQPHNIEGIEAFSEVFSGVPQVACFDTAFHVTMPTLEKTYGIPMDFSKRGIHKYGFHGLSYKYVSSRLARKSIAANGRLLMAHLGNGSSLCAAVNCQSVASTMGFSAVEGLMMGTRSGSIDPGVILYLMEDGWSHQQIVDLLYKQGGLKGVSGISADMRTLRASSDPSAEFATHLYAYRVIKESGALIAAMKGIDAIAFTGGIGEHDGQLREEVCEHLSFLGIQIDHELNAKARGDQMTSIHAKDSEVEIWVVPTDEGRVAAEETIKLLTL